VFDGGTKKLPRVHQYFGTKQAQEHVRQRKGGIIWHTQGSGKSIVMVLLGKWILENNPKARVVIITDRDELDKQIKNVFADAGEAIIRTSSGRDLIRKLAQAKPRLLCSLVHKFGRQRAALYQSIASLVRAYAGIADEMDEAGYSSPEIGQLKKDIQRALDIREIIRRASDEVLDLKAYEADMRHLIDTYIEADAPRKISPFDNISLLDLIVKSGIAEAIASQMGKLRGDKNAIAETIENNVRKTIVKKHLSDPASFHRRKYFSSVLMLPYFKPSESFPAKTICTVEKKAALNSGNWLERSWRMPSPIVIRLFLSSMTPIAMPLR